MPPGHALEVRVGALDVVAAAEGNGADTGKAERGDGPE